jgi:hypothetical protein
MTNASSTIVVIGGTGKGQGVHPPVSRHLDENRPGHAQTAQTR